VVRIRESVWRLMELSLKFAQVVFDEAESHRRRFPNFCLRRVAC